MLSFAFIWSFKSCASFKLEKLPKATGIRPDLFFSINGLQNLEQLIL